MTNIKNIARQLGREEMSARLGVKAGAISAAVVSGCFPASWYKALSDLGQEKGVVVPRDYFNWKIAERLVS